MITFFTTTKSFEGQNAINQLNAIHSWLQATCPVEVIVFGHSPGLDQVVTSLQLTHIDDIATSDRGIPLINAMFVAASSKARYNICCFLNADIILTQSFVQDIIDIHKKLKRKYLVVGQRWDVDVFDSIDFSSSWESSFFKRYQASFQLHTPTGSDYFVFPKGQYTPTDIPDLLVGRPGWDLWMIYNARKRKFKTIDLSFSSKAIHQNHDYSHKVRDETKRKEEDEVNYKYFLPSEKYIYTLLACNYYYYEHRLRKNYVRGDLEEYYYYEYRLNRSRKFYFLMVRFEVKFLKYMQRIKESFAHK